MATRLADAVRGRSCLNLAAAFFLCLAGAAAWPAEQGRRRAAEYLPEETILCVEVAPWRQWARDWDQTSLAGMAKEAELRSFLAGPLNKLKTLFGPAAPEPAKGEGKGEASAVGGFLDSLANVAAGPLVVALCYSEEDAKANRAPGIALVLGTADVVAAQRATVIASLANDLLRLFGADLVRQEAYGNARLLAMNAGRIEPTFCFYQENFILTSRAALCKQVVDGLSGTLARKLADKEAYQACRLTGAEHKSVFLDMAMLRRALGTQARAGKVREVLSAAGLEDMRAIAWSLRMNGPAFETRTAILSAGPRKGWLAALEPEPLNLEALKVCRPGCTFAVGARLRPDQLLPVLQELLHRSTGKAEADRLAAVEKKLAAQGRNLRSELSQAFGSELALSTLQTRQGAPAGALTVLVGSLTVRDAARAEALVRDLGQRMAAERGPDAKSAETLKELAYEGAKIFYLEPAQGAVGLAPVFGLAGQQFIVALDLQALKAAIHALPEKSLAQSEEFQAALKGVGGRPGSLFVYVDYAYLAHSLFDLSATALKFLGTMVPLREVGIDVALLPSPEVLTRHLFPALAVAQTTADGVVLTSRSPLPSLELLAPPLGAAAAVTATLTAELLPEEKPAETKK